MIRLTASSLSRAEACIGSAVLPGYVESTVYASVGTAVDEFIQAARRDRTAALRTAPESLRPYLEALTLDRIPVDAEFQVAYALNALTGSVVRIPGRTEGYPDDMGPEWIFGTADIVYRRDDLAVVHDIKWGNYTQGRDPATDLQLGFYGVTAAAVSGVDDAEVGFLRAGWDSVLRPESVHLDTLDLAAMRDRIVAIWRRVREAERRTDPPMLHVGEHCGYCPARRGCDAMVAPTALVLQADIHGLAELPPTAPATLRDRVRALTPEQRGRAYVIAGKLEDRAKAIRAAIRDDARLEPIPVGDGKVLKEVQWGARRSSPTAQEREAALEEELRATGEVMTVRVPKVRVVAAKKQRAALDTR